MYLEETVNIFINSLTQYIGKLSKNGFHLLFKSITFASSSSSSS